MSAPSPTSVTSALAPLPAREIEAGDLAACRAILVQGSRSFESASRLLPARVREPTAVLYAFCRVADDAVDGGGDARAAVSSLRERLDRIYGGVPDDGPVDRAFARVVRDFQIPKALPQALIEGFEWDSEGRRYESIEALEAYGARVASSVGVMMTRLFGSRDPEVLARAADLGLAMQLTNIARDVGEDARAGRIYLPLSWLRAAGIDPGDFLLGPEFSHALGGVVKRLLAVAERYYARADFGISMLPRDCRVAIRAARLIYADIGRVIATKGYDSVENRAYTSQGRKLWLLLRSLLSWAWPTRPSGEPPESSTRFLVDAWGA